MKMKRVRFDDLKSGDFVMAVSKKMCENNDTDDKWYRTYFIAGTINTRLRRIDDIEYFVDFDDKNRFLRIDTFTKGIGTKNNIKFYKLTEKEFYNKVSKFIVLEGLKGGKCKK